MKLGLGLGLGHSSAAAAAAQQQKGAECGKKEHGKPKKKKTKK